MKYFILLFISLLLYSCSSIPNIQGGPEDNTPPELKNTKYKGNKLILEFDENIQLANTESIVHSNFPNPKISYNRNKVIVDGIPQDSTKYIINFNNSIQDLNKNNPLINYIFADFVGDDTFTYSGTIKDVFKGLKNFKNCYIILTKDNPQLDSVNSFYNYNYTKTDDSGNFKLYFIPDYKAYNLFAFVDLNNNKKLDSLDYQSPLYSLDTINNNAIYVHNNLVIKSRIDTTLDSKIKTYYSNNYFLALANRYITEDKNAILLNDTIYNYKLITDTVYTSPTKQIIPSVGFKVLSNYKSLIQYDSSIIYKRGNNYSLKLKDIEKDTTVMFTNTKGDTLFQATFIPSKKSSTFQILSDSNTRYYGFLYSKNAIYYLEYTKKNKIMLLPGKYKLFIYEDLNYNSKFDLFPKKDVKQSDRVIYNLKDIDIAPNMDVEIGV